MHIDDQTYQRNGKIYRRALLRNSYRKNGKVVHDTIANLSMCSEEEIEVMKFATDLKKADITPLHKKLANIYKENYRPVSLLPLVSKIFERLMLKQMKPFIESFLSKWLCGYRMGFNAQYTLIAMIEKMKTMLDKSGGIFGAVLMD